MRRFIPAVLVSCVLALGIAAQETVSTGEILEGRKCLVDPTQTYSLYLPSYLTADRKWPLLYVFDPRGRATMAAEIFREAAEMHGWIIISSNDTRSDGPPDPNIRAINALWPEMSRYPIDTDRVYMTGFSGGAILAFLLADGGEVAGVIGCGGRFPDGWDKHPVKFSHWGVAGSVDFNYSQMRFIDEYLEETGSAHRFESFEGPHAWMPPELAMEAIAWMELDAMRRGLRERDQEMIATMFDSEISKAKTLETDGLLLEASEQWREVQITFSDLADLTEVDGRVEALGKDNDVRRARKERKKWDSYEETMRRQMGIAVATLRHEERLVPIGRLVGELRIDELQKRGKKEGYESLAANRVLSSMYAQMSFYLHREFIGRQDYARAALVLTVAEMLRPGSSFIRYNLACALARAGDRSGALEALKSAIDAGFSDTKLLLEDPDLESLRDTSEFGVIVATME